MLGRRRYGGAAAFAAWLAVLAFGSAAATGAPVAAARQPAHVEARLEQVDGVRVL